MADVRGLAACISFAGVLIFFLLFQQKQYQKGSNRNLALFYKGLATCFAGGLGLYGAFLAPSLPAFLLAGGLFACAAADVILGKKLLYGVAAFGISHVFYCAAFITKTPPTIWSLCLFLVLACGAGLAYPKLRKISVKQPVLPFFCYGLVLFLMLSLALPQKPLLFLGALFFVLSDLMLAYRIFTQKTSKPFDYICLGCYYLAQFLIGASQVF